MADLRSLDYFRTVIEHGSFRGAAEALGLTQPALTKSIKRLEDRFGALLFDRTSQGVTLTIFGQTLLRHASEVNASIKSAIEEIDSLRQGISGIVRLGAGPSWQGAILPTAIADLRRKRPNIHFKVVGGSDAYLKTLLKAGDIDLVLAAVPDAPSLEPDLSWEPLLEDEYVVIANTAHPLFREEVVTWDSLLAYPWILPPATTYMAERLHFLLRSLQQRLPIVAIETDAISLKFSLMAEDMYLSLHARTHLDARAPSNISVLEAPHMPLLRRAGLISRHGTSRSPSESLLIAHLKELCKRSE